MDILINICRWAFYGLGMVLIVIMNGCTKNFDMLNTPQHELTVNQISTSELGQAMAFAQYWGLVGDDAGWELMHELHGSIYSQIFATTSSGFNTDQYQESPSWVDAGWRAFYSRPAVMLNFVEEYTNEHNLPAENAIAKIYKVLIYGYMTDYFGAIPYSQFGNGKTSVSYDSQESIYNNFFQILDEAVTVLNQHTNEKPFGSNDIVFGGDVGKWIKFANSLRLRIAMRVVYVDPIMAKQQAEKSIIAGVMEDNGDNALILTTAHNLNYLTRWTYINPFGMSATQQSILVGYEDPRLERFWNQGGGRLGGNRGYNGLRNGLPRNLKTTSVRNGTAGNSFVSDHFLPIADGGDNPPCIAMTAAEVYLLRAEGALRGWDMGSGSAEYFYNQGISQSLKYWTNSTEQVIQNYINSLNKPVAVPDGIVGADFNSPPASDVPVKFGNSAGFEFQLEQIITQKWINSFLTPWEAWAERRRTGYPRGYAIIESINPNIPVTAIIRRLSYPPSEFSNNRVAVDEAVNKFLNGENNTITRVWWDKKPLEEYPDLSSSVIK